MDFRGRPLTPGRVIDGAARRIRLAWLNAPTRSVRSLYGPVLTKRRGDVTFVMSAMGAYGALIPNVIASVEEEFVFLDIGANTGVFSLVAAAAPNCSLAIAVEPVPETFAALSNNIRINNANKVVPLCAAIANTSDRIVRLSHTPKHSGASRLVRNQSQETGRLVFALVANAAAIDAILETAQFERLVCKIDVEGLEAEVLSVLRESAFFPKMTDTIIEVSELTGTGTSNVADVRRLMADWGFAEMPGERSAHYDAHFHRPLTSGHITPTPDLRRVRSNSTSR